MKRRSVLKWAGASLAGSIAAGQHGSSQTVPGLQLAAGAGAAAVSVRDVGSRRQLFIDERFVEQPRNVSIHPVTPDLQRENVLVPDRPWESGRVCSWGSIAEHDGKIRLWYDAREWSQEKKMPVGVRQCYAESADGVHFEKPNTNRIAWNGSTDNNMVAIATVGSIFVDPLDEPSRRFKALMDTQPDLDWLHWSELKGIPKRGVYLFHSPDGKQWKRSPHAVVPTWLGGQQSVIWDDRISRWVAYLRAHRPYRCYGRIELERDQLAGPYPLRLAEGRSYEPQASRPLTDELPIVMERDDQDPPGGQPYSMNAWKYPEAEDVYFAFLPMWYEARKGTGGSDRVEAQLGISRDGIQWSRPWRRPIIPTGSPSLDWAGQIWPLPSPVIRNQEVWLYYLSEPDTHLSFANRPNYVSKAEDELMADPKSLWSSCVVARAIWRRDRLAGVEAGPRGGEFCTPPIRFSGADLVVNANASASGKLRVGVEEPNGAAIAGFGLDDSLPIQGNGRELHVRWKGVNFGQLAGRAVRLRFELTNCQLFAFQAV